MHLYATERPEASPGRKALLIDGSAVPQIMAMPLENGHVQLTVMLREHLSGELYSYAQHHVELTTNSLEIFFENYLEDPELTLAHWFNWAPQPAAVHKPSAREKLEAQNYVESLL